MCQFYYTLGDEKIKAHNVKCKKKEEKKAHNLFNQKEMEILDIFVIPVAKGALVDIPV